MGRGLEVMKGWSLDDEYLVLSALYKTAADMLAIDSMSREEMVHATSCMLELGERVEERGWAA